MPVNTVSAAVNITPVVIRTFWKHYFRQAKKLKSGEEWTARDDVLFDEAFNIVKSFIILGTRNTVESLQAFTNTHVLSPPWAAVAPVLIPFKTCNKAADTLIQWFSSPGELRNVVGGSRWWQVRGLDGLEAEWVTEKSFLHDDDVQRLAKEMPGNKSSDLSDNEQEILAMDHLERVMLYIHGGAYFWGSINTHRYQIIKYARKIQGRVLAVNYRKAPQYPWPCPLHDALAAYMYLTNPPPDALHSPVPPEKIVLAGDSAGAGLCITLLTLLRDLDIELPAGAVLISPWVDLTHSFPSVMTNTKTDIIPPHGFIHKPSVVWPIDALPRKQDRVIKSEEAPPPKPGHADTLRPSSERLKEETRRKKPKASELVQEKMLRQGHSSVNDASARKSSRAMAYEDEISVSGHSRPNDAEEDGSNNEGATASEGSSSQQEHESWDPKPPKVLMDNPDDVPLELRSQIQLYATNEQLTHPLVSPILQGSLGNLCPLYIIAGDGECLRDEIIYLAHRAAYPEEYPPRHEAIKESKRQQENVERFKTPTKVHLQVFDDMCHVLTVFTFLASAKYAYRSIAEFVKHVTAQKPGSETQPPFPELKIEPELPKPPDPEQKDSLTSRIGNGLKSSVPFTGGSDKSVISVYDSNKAAAKEHTQENPTLNRIATFTDSDESLIENTLLRNFSNVIMIRERVDIRGRVRQMEDRAEIPCLKSPASEIGLLKEAPVRRWLAGQQEWDRKFKSTAKRVSKRRRKIREKYEHTIERAKELGLLHSSDDTASILTADEDLYADGNNDSGEIQRGRRWGPLDLVDEDPPPSAIAGRRDTMESLALLKKTLYFTAPRTVKRMPQRKTKDLVIAAFDPYDDPRTPPRQSKSEQQHVAEAIPVHGLNIWASMMLYFTKRTTSKGKHKTLKGFHKVKGSVKAGPDSRSPSQSRSAGKEVEHFNSSSSQLPRET